MKRFPEVLRSAFRQAPVTISVMFVCLVMFLLVRLVSSYTAVTNAIFLGAYYKPLILAGQWWRLLSVGLIHIDAVHLFVNMMSLFNLGHTFERSFGSAKMGTVLAGGVIGGSLFMMCTEGNTVGVGLSGGLYALMGGYTYMLIMSGYWKQPEVMRSLFSVYLINLMINFMPGVAATAHLGGYVAGVLLTGLLVDKAARKHFITASLAFCLFTGYMVSQRLYISENDRYYGTDLQILAIYQNAGWDRLAEATARNLDNVYHLDGILEAGIHKGE